jgi:hypothetical protein
LTQGPESGKLYRMSLKDFTHDPSLAFLALLKEAGALPAWVTSAPEAAELEGLPSLAFADSSNRLFPMHTKAAAFLSAVSAFVYDHPGEAWQDRLKTACHSYSIVDEVRAAHTVLAPQAPLKEAAATPLYKFATELILTPGGAPVGYYPITTASQTEASALKLARDIAQEALPASWLGEAAEALVKAAAEQGVPAGLIPQVVHELGEARLPSAAYLASQLAKRAAFLPTGAVALYKEAADGVLGGATSAADGAHFWELADRKFGVKYANFLVPPVDAFRSGRTVAQLQKEASASVLVAGVLVPLLQLQTLPDRLVASLFEKRAAAGILAAMGESDGIAASQKVAALQETEQVDLLQLLIDAADGSSRAA